MKSIKFKITVIILTFTAILIPIVIFAQAGSPDTGNSSQLMSFLQGDTAMDSEFISQFSTLINTYMSSYYSSLKGLGQAIGGGAAICYISYLGWQMEAGDREWEIMPMLKPFGIAFVLMIWPAFVNMLSAPLDELRDDAAVLYATKEHEAEVNRLKRFHLEKIIVDQYFEHYAEIEAQNELQQAGTEEAVQEDPGWLEEQGNKLVAALKEMKARLTIQLKQAISATIENCALVILRICAYGIIFISIIFTTILIVLGPIPIGLSVFPMFSSAFGNWVAKFINIKLYGFIAYMIMTLGNGVIDMSYQRENDRYLMIVNMDGSLKNMDLLVSFSSYGFFSFGWQIVAYIVVGVALFTTPMIADSIITAGGNAQMMSKMKQSAGKIASGAGGAVSAGKTVGKATASGIKQIKQGMKNLTQKSDKQLAQARQALNDMPKSEIQN